MVFKSLSVTFALAAVLLRPGPVAGQSGPEVTVFATPEQCGQVLSLTTDDAGRLYAAVTGRAFGRGTVSAMGNPVLAAQDQAVRSTAAREQLVTGWLGSGKLAPLLEERGTFYQSAGDGPSNFLTKYSESVRWLTDVNRDGKAEAAMVVAEAFRDPMDGPGSALLALPKGRWFYGCPPNLWRLEDRNDDQRAEERASLAEGFGLRNDPWGADMHALLEAPDGWIYWTMGARGYALREANGTRIRGLGSGAVFRCRADGSGLERVARGLRNPTALVMKPDGQLLVVDEAAPGGKTRLLQVLPGADFGWQAESGSAPGAGLWVEEGMETATLRDAPSPGHPQWMLPALTTIKGPCSALEILPDGTLLAADPQGDGQGGLSIWTLQEDVAPYQVKVDRRLWQGGAVRALTQSVDGSVYFAEWGDRVDAAGRCRIRRLTWPPSPPVDAGPEKETAMSTIRRIPELTVRELKGLLGHAGPRVALRARQRLEGLSFQDSLEALLQVARRGATLPARLHGLRGAGAVARQDSALLNELTSFLNDPEPSIRATAATLLGEGNLPDPPPALRRALQDEAQSVRLAAAAALARIKPTAVLMDLVQAAARNTGRDALIRSSLAHALAEAVPAPALAETAVQHASAEVRLTAVLALRRMEAPEVAEFLADSDNVVATEAARAVYDLPLRPAFPRLAAMLDGPARPLPVQRRALAAAVYLGTSADAGRVAAFAVRPDTLSLQRSAALTALETWDQPPTIDPLWHRQEVVLPRLPGVARASARSAAEVLRNDPDNNLAAQALKLWNACGPVSSTARLATVTNSQARQSDRLAALLSLIAGNELSIDTARTLTDPGNPSIPDVLRAEARSLLMRRDPKNAVLLLSEALTTGSMLEKQTAIQTLDRLPGNNGDNEKLILELAKRLGIGAVERGLQVEVLEALQRRDTETRSAWRRATEAWLASLSVNLDPLAAWRMTMENGDAAAGRLIFETHPEAACLSCHSTAGIGGLKGPDLDGVADRLTNGGLLESLIQPGAKIVKSYALAVTPPPREVADEAAASLMPPMGTLLTLRELRDLIAYLRTLKAP